MTEKLESDIVTNEIHINRELLNRCSCYVFEFLGYERPEYDVREKYLEPNPTIIVGMYSELHDKLSELEQPVTDETLSARGFKVIKTILDAEKVRTLEEILDIHETERIVQDCEEMFGGAK